MIAFILLTSHCTRFDTSGPPLSPLSCIPKCHSSTEASSHSSSSVKLITLIRPTVAGSNISTVSPNGSYVYDMQKFIARPYWIGHLNTHYVLANGSDRGAQSQNFNVSYDNAPVTITWGATASSTPSATSVTSISIASATATDAKNGTSAGGSSSPSGSLGITSGGGISGGAIAGIVIGVIALLALLGLGAFFLGRKARARKQNPQDANILPPNQPMTAYQQQQQPLITSKNGMAGVGAGAGNGGAGELPAHGVYAPYSQRAHEVPDTTVQEMGSGHGNVAELGSGEVGDRYR